MKAERVQRPAAAARTKRPATDERPGEPKAQAILQLQHSAGNRAVGEMVPARVRPSAQPVAALLRHSSWEHQLLGDAKPDNLAKIGTWENLIEQTKRQGVKRTPRQASASVTIDLGGTVGQVSVTKGNVMHILAQHLKLLSDWQDNPPQQDSGGKVDQTWQAVLVSVPGGKPDGTPLVITYGEMNTLADYYGNLEVMRGADKAKRYEVIQSVRQETFFRLREIFDKLKKSLTSTEAGSQDVQASLAEIGKNKRYAQKVGYKLGYKFKGAITPEYISGTSGQLGLLSKFGGAGGKKSNEYAATLGRNACHFVPESWHAWASYHEKARELAWSAAASQALADIVPDPKEAAKHKAQAANEINEALITNGFGDHYLQDSYASGHMINKTQIMQWFVQWLDKHDWKADFASDENWRRVQAIAYNQPEIASAMQYDKSKIQGATPAQKKSRARNPQAVEDIGGDWKKRFDALGLAVPASLAQPGTDTRTVVEWWQAEAAEHDGLDQTGAALAARIHGPAGALIAALDALIKDSVITPLDISAAYAGRKLMSGRFELGDLPPETLLMMKFRLRKEYVPRDMKTFRAQQKKTAKGDDTGYQRAAAAITYQDFFQFLNNGYVQKSTNALHNKFCKKGLDVVTGDGLHAFRVYGDDNMFRANSADGVKHSGETANMSRDAILGIIGGQKNVPSTADILRRLPSKVQPDGAAAPVDLAVWHNPAAKDQLRNYCETNVFPGMGVIDKAVGMLGDLSKFISKDYAPPHGAEAF